MELIDGKATAAKIKEEIAAEVEQIVANGGKRPHLAAILVGHDGGSETYVKNKVLACEKCGFKSTLLRFEDDITEEQLLAEVDKLNKDADVDGFIVQLPLPKHISEQKVIEAIDYRKDVDGFHPINVRAYKRKEMRNPWTKQYRWQTNGTAYDAKAVRRLNRNRMPQPLRESEEGMSSG